MTGIKILCTVHPYNSSQYRRMAGVRQKSKQGVTDAEKNLAKREANEDS